MKPYLHKHNIALVVITLLILFVFSPGFTLYFHQDDFIHMTYSDRWEKVLYAFNIFQKGDFPFYRPIPTQVYFYTLGLLFGLNPLGYHIVNAVLLILNVMLVYVLALTLLKSKTAGILSAFFFGINATHIGPMYAPAYCHELFYVSFGLGCILSFIKRRYILSFIFFICALMSKETAVVLPGIIGITHVYSSGFNIRRLVYVLIPYTIVLAAYLFAHVYFYGLAEGPSYAPSIGKQTINIFIWYILWGLSVPNILIDFVGPGLRLNPVFFQITQAHGWFFFISFVCFIITVITGFFLTVRNQYKKFAYCGVWFVLGMIPLIIFPLHKLATEQAFSLIGLSMLLSVIFKNMLTTRKFITVGLVLYLFHAANTMSMAPKTHWIATSARQAKLTIDYLLATHPDVSENDVLYFKDGEIKIPAYGSARQIYQATGNGKAIGIIYHNPDIQYYFDESKPLPDELKNNPRLITLDASKFLGY